MPYRSTSGTNWYAMKKMLTDPPGMANSIGLGIMAFFSPEFSNAQDKIKEKVNSIPKGANETDIYFSDTAIREVADAFELIARFVPNLKERALKYQKFIRSDKPL